LFLSGAQLAKDDEDDGQDDGKKKAKVFLRHCSLSQEYPAIVMTTTSFLLLH